MFLLQLFLNMSLTKVISLAVHACSRVDDETICTLQSKSVMPKSPKADAHALCSWHVNATKDQRTIDIKCFHVKLTENSLDGAKLGSRGDKVQMAG